MKHGPFEGPTPPPATDQKRAAEAPSVKQKRSKKNPAYSRLVSQSLGRRSLNAPEQALNGLLNTL